MDETSVLNELKSLILSKAGIRSVTPGDCKRISIEISKALNKSVSETTIKRLFGFAVVKHNFSQFTLTTLFEYVDNEKLIRLIPREKNTQDKDKDDWESLRHYAEKTTDFTLKGIRNRSGLPYEMTISRKFAEHDFEEFYNSNFSFMCFISQPGYGKTTLLSHLVEDYFYKENAPYKDSNVLFVKAYSFFKKDGDYYDLEAQIRAELGISAKKDLFGYLHEQHQARGGKFVLIIDGFADLALKKDIKNQLFDSILNFICALDSTNLVKVVLSMRSTSWIRFYERMRHSAYLRANWFQGNYFDVNDVSNVPPLTEREVEQIISNTGHFDLENINPKLKTQLKFPFHIHLYYQLKEEDPFINYYTNIAFYELVSRFIKEKIYKSNYYTEKILFLKKIIQLTDYGKSQNFVAKDLLIAELSAFKNAYMELLSDGILMEERRYQNLHPREFVRFLYPHIFEYFLFIELLEKFNLNVDAHFLEYIDKTYSSNHVRFILLQWTIRYMVKTADFVTLSHIFKLDLNNYERNYLILFIAENLKYAINLHPEIKDTLKEHQLHDAIIKELINFDFVDSCYKQSITVLIDICDKDEHWLLYQSILSALDILSLNKEKLEQRIIQLESRRDLCASSYFNPLEALRIAYNKSQNIPVHSSPLLEKIDSFIVSEDELRPLVNEMADTWAGVQYILMLSVNTLYGTPEKTVQIIHSIQRLHPRLFYKRAPFASHLLLLLALNGVKSDQCKKAERIRHFILKIAKDRNSHAFTKYSELLFLMLNAELSKQEGDYVKAISHAEEALVIFKRNDLNIHCVQVYNLIIEMYSKLNDLTKLNEYRYERLCFLHEKEISKELFPLGLESTKREY